MLISSSECGFLNYFTSIIQPSRQVTIRGIHLLHRSHYSNLNKSLEYNTIQGIRLFSEGNDSNLFKSF